MPSLRKPRMLAVQPPSWSTTVSLLQRLQDHGWIFRGQHKAFWKLETTLERQHYIKNVGNPYTEAPDLRQYEKERINKYFEQFSSPILVRKPGIWEAIMTMQHYGWPTRLLDFTKCFKRAIFFALTSEPSEPWAIWCINGYYLKCISIQKVKALLARSKEPVTMQKLLFQSWILDVIDNELFESDEFYRMMTDAMMTVAITKGSIYDIIEQSISFVAQPVGHLIDNERIYKQRGLFLAPYNLGHHPDNIYHDSRGLALISRFEKNLLDSLGFDKDGLAEYVEANQKSGYQSCQSDLPIDDYALIKFVLSPSCYGDARSLLISDPSDLIDAFHLGLADREEDQAS